MENWDLKLGSRIVSMNRHNGFLSAITKGERGYGKSMYNLKVMAYVFYHLIKDCSIDQAWDKALSSIIFTPDQFLNVIEYNLSNDYLSPVICIDDATVHFSSYLYFINLYETSLLHATFDTIRTATHSILLNCPSKRHLLTGLRNYDDYEITIYKGDYGGFQRKAVGIKWYSLPDGHRKFRKSFEDYFSCFVPDDVYNRYMVLRTKYLKDVSEELKKLRNKLSKKKIDK